jgi:hypothetical protein
MSGAALGQPLTQRDVAATDHEKQEPVRQDQKAKERRCVTLNTLSRTQVGHCASEVRATLRPLLGKAGPRNLRPHESL